MDEILQRLIIGFMLLLPAIAVLGLAMMMYQQMFKKHKDSTSSRQVSRPPSLRKATKLNKKVL